MKCKIITLAASETFTLKSNGAKEKYKNLVLIRLNYQK